MSNEDREQHVQDVDRVLRNTALIQRLSREIADESAASLIQCSCLSREYLGGSWLDLTTIDESDTGAIRQAVRYLELRKLIRRHPDDRNQVQLL